MATDHEQRSTQVSSAPPSQKQLSDDERRTLYNRLRERMRRSRLEILNPVSGRSYYWARKDDMEELSRLDMLGFRIVKSDPKIAKPIANGLRDDGCYRLGDVILMDIEQSAYEFYLQENLNRSDALVKGAKESFRDEAERQGVPTFEVNQPKGA